MDRLLITNKDKDKYNSLSFICKALGNESDSERYRTATHLIQVQGNRIAGTDGHRLHIAELEELQLDNGLYSVTKTAKQITLIKENTELRFPNIEQVMPETEGRDCFYFSPDKRHKDFER